MKNKKIAYGIACVGLMGLSFYGGMKMDSNKDVIVSKSEDKTGYQVEMKEDKYYVSLTNDKDKIVFNYVPVNKKVDSQRLTIPVGKD